MYQGRLCVIRAYATQTRAYTPSQKWGGRAWRAPVFCVTSPLFAPFLQSAPPAAADFGLVDVSDERMVGQGATGSAQCGGAFFSPPRFNLHRQPATLFADTPLANKVAILQAAIDSKERTLVASLEAKANTTLGDTVAAYKNLTFGNAVSVVQPPANATTASSGTLQCVVGADGVVAGLVGRNGELKKKGGGQGQRW